MTTEKTNPKYRYDELCDQAERLIATHLMGFEIRRYDEGTDGDFQELYFKDGQLLGHVGLYEFHPAKHIQDAFWVIATVTNDRDISFVIDTNAKRETEVTLNIEMGADGGVLGVALQAPLAITKAMLYLIVNDHPHDETLCETIDELYEALEQAEDAVIEYGPDGEGHVVNFDEFIPTSDDIDEVRRAHPRIDL